MALYKNPILPGFHPDPTVCRVGGDFYLVTSSFEYFPGLPIYHSRDLVHWAQIGNVLDRDSQLPLRAIKSSDGLWAPTLRHYNGTFYLTCNLVGGGGNFIVTSVNPAGPWSEPIWLNDYGIDGSMLFDTDGKIYYSRAATDGQNGVFQAELDPVTLRPSTPFRKIWEYIGEWNEGPHLYKALGKYYVIVAAGGTEYGHHEVAARGDSPWGPFEACPFNPILMEKDNTESNIQSVGHADLVEGIDGSWWAVFLGMRPNHGFSALGRETFLAPVKWTKDGWPIIGDHHHVALEMEAPAFMGPRPGPVSSRTFFDRPLGPEWIYVRNPERENYSLSAKPGYLTLRGSETALGQVAPQTFIGRRQEDFKARVRCAMEFSPALENEEAGLCLRANDENYCQIALGRTGGQWTVFVRTVLKSEAVVRASFSGGGARAYLEIAGDESRYRFSWSEDGEQWRVLAEASASDVSPEKIKSFTGAVIGMYATGNGKPCETPAYFEWFEYQRWPLQSRRS